MAAIEQSTLAQLGRSGEPQMIKLNNLSETVILENLRRRYLSELIYTYTGSILVSVNPYRFFDIYNTDQVRRYTGQKLGDQPPHVFAIAEHCYTQMRLSRRNQSVIISGESGAGKTEATKLILQYLSAMTGTHSECEQGILESSPLLEAFGNARTVRNNNSSRFGKFIEVSFTAQGAIQGARIQQFLLERSRVTKQSTGERGYHVFYQLLAGATPEERARMELMSPADYTYTNQGGDTSIPGVDDADDFDRIRTAMDFLQFPPDMQSFIFDLLAAILHLGNVQFAPAGDGSTVSNPRVLATAARLMQVDPTELAKALTTRINRVRTEVFVIPLLPPAAVNTRDALAKAVYAKLFEWLVGCINRAIDRSNHAKKPNFIGVLDIFGFENFNVNSFEQLCINYANEKLAAQFNRHIFQEEQAEYEKEKINWSKITYKDNSKNIELIELRAPPGIVAILDEETRFPKATDATFLDKLHTNFAGKHESYEKPKLARESFIVKHYAGPVEYNTREWLEKNRDVLREDLQNVVVASKSPVLSQLFVAAAGADAAKAPTVAATFKNSLLSLVDTLNATDPSYIRCIKPNPIKVAGVFDDDMVLAQLRYAGMMETIKIRALGLPLRYPFDEFYGRYRVIAPAIDRNNPRNPVGIRQAVQHVLKHARSLIADQWQLGATKVFMRDVQYHALERERDGALTGSALVVQAWWRMVRVRRRFVRKRAAAIVVQATFRRYWYRLRFQMMRGAAVLIQAMWKMVRLRRKYKPIIRQRVIDTKRRIEEEKRRAEEERRRMVEERKKIEEQNRQAALQKSTSKSALSPRPGLKVSSAAVAVADDDDSAVEAFLLGGEPLTPRGLPPPPSSLSPPPSPRSSDAAGTTPTFAKPLPAPPGRSSSAADSEPDGLTPSDSEIARWAAPTMTMRGRMGALTMRRNRITVLEAIPDAPPVLAPHERQHYPWDKFVEKQFQRQQAKGLLKKGKLLSSTEASSFSKNKLDKPLLPQKDATNEKRAGELFKMLLDLQTSKQDDAYAVQQLCAEGFKTPSLRDELFAQAIKQVSNCPKKEYADRGWWVLTALCCSFPPSHDARKYVAAFLIQSEASADVGATAKFALLRFNRVCSAKPRALPPGPSELNAIKARQPIVCRFELLDNNKKALHVDGVTTAKEVYGHLCDRVGLGKEAAIGYAIYECYNNLERSLNEDDSLGDAIAKFEKFYASAQQRGLRVNFRLLFKKKVFLEPTSNVEDEQDRSLCYYQARSDILTGRLPVSTTAAVHFGGLMLQTDYGDYSSGRETKITSVQALVPKPLWTYKAINEWTDELVQSWLGHLGKNKEECKVMFLRHARQLEFYGYTLFSVTHRSDWNIPAKFDLAIGREGIHFLNDLKEKAYSYALDDVLQHSFGPKSVKLFFADAKSPTGSRAIELGSMQGIEISSVISDYQFYLEQEATHCRALVNYVTDDYALLPYSVGDLITVYAKDESGWWSGECKGKEGMFNVKNVKVLLRPPPEVAAYVAAVREAERTGKAPPPPPAHAKGNSGRSGSGQMNTRVTSARKSMMKMAHMSTNFNAAASGKPVNKEQFNIEKFAEQFFRKQGAGAGAGGGAKTLVRRNINRAQLMDMAARVCFSKEPMKSSLIDFESDDEAVKKAVESFLCILKYMDDYPLGKKDTKYELASTLIRTGLTEPKLRSEIYCQLMKQTTSNPRVQSATLGWQLISLCAGCFLPSKDFLNHLVAYVHDHKSFAGDLGRFATACVDRLSRCTMKGTRMQSPSLEEFNSVLAGEHMSMPVNLCDSTVVTVDIDSSTPVQEVLNAVKKNIGVPEAVGWGLVEVISGLDSERPVSENDRVCDLLATWQELAKTSAQHRNVRFSLLFKRIVYLRPSEVPDVSTPLYGLMYAQAHRDVVRGRIPVTKDVATRLAGLALQVEHGDYNPARPAVSESNISVAIPSALFPSLAPSVWLQDVLQVYKSLMGSEDVRAEYLSVVMKWPFYGAFLFLCKQRKAPQTVFVAINRDGVALFEPGAVEPCGVYPFSKLSSWAATATAFTLVAGSLQRPDRVALETTQGQSMINLIQVYIDALLVEKSLAAAAI